MHDILFSIAPPPPPPPPLLSLTPPPFLNTLSIHCQLADTIKPQVVVKYILLLWTPLGHLGRRLNCSD